MGRGPGGGRIVTVQWWCSAQGVAWSWSWRAYPGVWLMIAAAGAFYARLWHRRHVRRPTDTRHQLAAVGGLWLLWIGLDWPLGTLGAGYLASAHMVQFIIIVLAATPLLVLGLPQGDAAAAGAGAGVGLAVDAGAGPAAGVPGRVLRVWRALTQPLVALIVFTVLIIGTHAPPVVDALMGTQLGSMALDLAWIFAGVLFWWPVLSPGYPRPRLSPPLALVYLLGGGLPDKGIASWLLLSHLPVYRTYELAPPIPGTTPNSDQELAGGLMLTAGMLLLVVASGIVFHLWVRAEERIDRAAAPESRLEERG